jgi:hypothetical protein
MDPLNSSVSYPEPFSDTLIEARYSALLTVKCALSFSWTGFAGFARARINGKTLQLHSTLAKNIKVMRTHGILKVFEVKQ